MILNEQAENTSLKNQLEAALGTSLQPSSAGVDDEDDEMDMEERGGGSSFGVTAYPFPNGDVVVRSVSANGEERRFFTADQKEEREQYIQALSRSPAASSSGAAGGSASGSRMPSEQRDHLIEEYNKLKVKYAALERKVKYCEKMDTMAVSACVCIH